MGTLASAAAPVTASLAAPANAFADRLITFLAITVAIVIVLAMTGEPRRDGVSPGRIVAAIAFPLLVIAAAVLLPSGAVGLLWF
ncbi:hypothetical protein [Allokutzneria oryzae]|uniref:Uncharacterized protein n=1 Tax=Allokutzneria oryzae TaxID=1378989 RepID=A0ABV6A637_9PSEU